jgi:hypothetical protein
MRKNQDIVSEEAVDTGEENLNNHPPNVTSLLSSIFILKIRKKGY